MTGDLCFNTLKVRNFRVFRNAHLQNLSRLNVLSGMNASGKSALIEILFMSLDLTSPTCLVRPFNWRNLPFTGDDLKILFPEKNDKAEITTDGHYGFHNISVNLGGPDEGILLSAAEANVSGAIQHLNTPNIEGANIISSLNGRYGDSTWRIFINQVGGEFRSTVQLTGDVRQNTPAFYLGHSVRSSPADLANRVSQIIKHGKKDDLLEHISFITDRIRDVFVLQDGYTAQVYVNTIEKDFLPIGLMGDGLHVSFEIICAAMVSRGGVMFLDEIDTLLHFSIVPRLWSLLARLSRTENLQVFAVTHSKEAILSASVGVESAGIENNEFQYVRIDVREGSHVATAYALDEVSTALALNVEIRS